MNSETDNHREAIIDTWSNEIKCNTCGKLLGYSNKFMATQYEHICQDCLSGALL